MKIIEEVRKEKRRRDLSDDSDDDNPFHNTSTAFGRGRLNATPASSTIRGDNSIAGRSRTSTIKGGAGPVNITGGKAGATTAGNEQEFTEDVGGVEAYQTNLKEIWSKRTQLMKVTKKKKKKKKGRSALRKTNTASAYETETAWDDDKTSFMTMNEIAENKEFLGLFDDKLTTVQRTFTSMPLPILTALGIENYDSVQSIDKLVFTMRDALA